MFYEMKLATRNRREAKRGVTLKRMRFRRSSFRRLGFRRRKTRRRTRTRAATWLVSTGFGLGFRVCTRLQVAFSTFSQVKKVSTSALRRSILDCCPGGQRC